MEHNRTEMMEDNFYSVQRKIEMENKVRKKILVSLSGFFLFIYLFVLLHILSKVLKRMKEKTYVQKYVFNPAPRPHLAVIDFKQQI